MKQLGSHQTHCHEILYLGILRKGLRKFKFHYNQTITAGTSHEDRCTYLVISRSVLLTLRNVSDKRCRENQNTHFAFNNFSENRAVYEIMRNIFRVGQTTDDKIIRRMFIACWTPRATGTHSEYVILIFVPLQQWLQECASMWRHSYIVYRDESQCNLYGKHYTSKKIVNRQNLRNKYWKTKCCKGKGKAVPLQAWTGPEVS
jgi:hypothetical protein